MSTPEQERLPRYKVVALGEQSSGKTSLMVRHIYGSFHETYMGTIGIDFMSTNMYIEGRKPIQLQIWDTAGQERFHSLLPSYLRDARLVFLVYDTTDGDAFSKIQKWINLIDREGTKPEVALLGNKVDLQEDRMISTEQGRELAKKHGFLYFETSAKTGLNVKRAFKEAATSMLEPSTELARRDEFVNVVLDTVQPDETTEGCSC